MYYNPYSYWCMYPQMPCTGYPMGETKGKYSEGMGNITKDCRKLLMQIMELEFALEEMSMYLDTHPNDREAVRLFNEYVKKLKPLKDDYRKKYGPLTHEEESGYPYQFVQGPWPWEL